MKISTINFIKQAQNNRNKNNYSIPILETQKIGIQANEIIANYNIAFSGLFKKDIQPQYDATRLTFEHKMQPNTPYLVAEDSKFSLGGYWINLKNEREKSLIQSLKAGEALIFGREGISFPGMNDMVSRKHLKIEKTKDERLIATDLGSTNGTTILPNIYTPKTDCGKFSLIQNEKYLLPKNSVFEIGGYVLNLSSYFKDISSMQDKETKNFTLNDEVVLQIEKFGEKIIAQNLSNALNISFLQLDETSFVNDYSEIHSPTTLQKNVPTLIPENSQLRLGKELTIDTRDKKINELLDRQRKIIVGRNTGCDYVVNAFNNQVSNRHLSIERTSKGLVVTDLGSTNDTIVIPNQHIKPFYSEIDGLVLQQGNIGDCTLLSALYSLSLNPKGKEIIKNMVTVDNDGSYLVKLPNHEPIKVTLDELYGQVNKKGERKNAVESELGIKAIERAYARYLKENENYEAPTMFGIIDEGDYLRTPLFNLTQVYPQTIKINKSNIDSLLQNIAYTGGTNCHVVTCSTPKKGKYGDYVDYKRRFIENHAYSIKRINPTDRTVEIVNPHNTKYYYALNFDEFSEYFTEICDLKL